MRAAAAALLTLVLLASVAVPADASQAQLERAQAAANRAARALADAETRQAEVEAEIAGLSARLAASTKELSTLSTVVKERAVAEYIRGSTDSHAPIGSDLTASLRATTLARFVALEDDDALDEFRRVTEDLDVLRAKLDAARTEARSLTEQMQQRADAAFAELKKLEKLEADRKAAEARKRAASRTTSSRRGAAFIAGSGSWMCPVQGPHAFSNDYGDPRSGGRSHQGNDILAPRGTPVVANVSGTVKRHTSSLGGLSYYLAGTDGNEYYGAHLDGYAGGVGFVQMGTVIGYVGTSGNARGGPPHLHFEIHPGGGRAVNPYPTLSKYC